MAEQGRVVARRAVFHIPGYDPFPARRYRELYRKEAAEQARISGYEIAVSGLPQGQGMGWLAEAQIDGKATKSQIEVLTWSDIVRDSMRHGIVATYQQLLITAWRYITTGVLRRLMWLRKGPVIAALYPVAMLLLQAVVAWGLGAFVGGLVAAGIIAVAGWTGLAESAFATWVSWAVDWIVFIVVFVFVLRGFRAIDHRLFAYYLMHDYAFTAKKNGAYPEELEQRLAEFRNRIAAACAGRVEEVLIVGHSSGAHLAVSLVADLLRAEQVQADGPKLALLTLGQVVPMVSFLPGARQLRGDLAFLQDHPLITWVDVSAPGDGCAFALCDPVAVSGVAREGKRWPLVISAAFRKTLKPATFRALRWRFFRLHFQYLCAFDAPGDYDYFQITAGPMLLADRYAGRKPSASRIDIAASKYRSVTP